MLPKRFSVAALIVISVQLLLGSGCSHQHPAPVSPSTADSSFEALIEVMGRRLALMPDVAEWKRAHGKAVRDRPRELIVLDNAVMAVDGAARRAGVAPFPEAAVRRFYQAQIDAAVSIQDRVIQEPPESAAVAPDLTTELRPELDRLGKRIAEVLVIQKHPPEPQTVYRSARRQWRIHGLEDEDIRRLAGALIQLLETPRIEAVD